MYCVLEYTFVCINAGSGLLLLGSNSDLVVQYVLLYISESCEEVNKLYHCDITSLPDGLEGFKGRKDLLPFVKLVDNFDARYRAIANDDTLFTFRTNKDAPKYKLVQVDLREPSTWTVVLEEAEKDVLESACAVNGNQILVCYLSDVKYVLQIRDLKTGSLLHDLPIDIGSVFDISARRQDSMVFIGFTSFLTPGIIYQCNLEAGTRDMKIFREIVVPGFDRTEFCVDQVNYYGQLILVFTCDFLFYFFRFILFECLDLNGQSSVFFLIFVFL